MGAKAASWRIIRRPGTRDLVGVFPSAGYLKGVHVTGAAKCSAISGRGIPEIMQGARSTRMNPQCLVPVRPMTDGGDPTLPRCYSKRTPNRAHVVAGQYLYWTSPSTSPSATKPIVRLSRELFRLSPSTKHVPSGTFALG